MSFHLEPQFSWLEVAVIVVLAALPMSQIAAIILGVVKRKTGIELHRMNGQVATEDTSEESENDSE